MVKLPQVILKTGRDKNLRARHPWVFSGAVDKVQGAPEPGATVAVHANNGDLLGVGAWSPTSQIQVRLWSHTATPIDQAFFVTRIQQAWDYRQHLGIPQHSDAYRVVYAESDGLPGVIVDLYGEWAVLQCLTVGAERWRAELVAALHTVLPVRGVYERSDAEVRTKEGLATRCGVAWGEPPPPILTVTEQGRRYCVDIANGHKTGFYLDQRDNRNLLQQYALGKTVLNCFSYTGGFAIAALRGGATHVTNIDASQPALEMAAQASTLNGHPPSQMENICADVFKLLRSYRAEGRQFDLIVLDPPKFADNRQQVPKAARGYKDINWLAFQLLKPDGLLFTFSCSGLLEEGLFQKIVADAAVDAGCDARIIHKLSQASDHPTRLAFPEGHYLKGLVCQK